MIANRCNNFCYIFLGDGKQKGPLFLSLLTSHFYYTHNIYEEKENDELHTTMKGTTILKKENLLDNCDYVKKSKIVYINYEKAKTKIQFVASLCIAGSLLSFSV